MMRIHLLVNANDVTVMARGEGPGDIVGDFRSIMHEGDMLLGWSYAEIRALGAGEHELSQKKIVREAVHH